MPFGAPNPKEQQIPLRFKIFVHLCASIHEKREICPWISTGCPKLYYIHMQPSFVSIENKCHFSYQPNH